jgi:histidine triad (HIT) family protein
MKVAQKILKAIEVSALNCEGANIFISDGKIAGQEVPHVHLHIVPRFSGDGIKVSFGKPHRRDGREELNKIASIISASLK